jgi:hypothetical protein
MYESLNYRNDVFLAEKGMTSLFLAPPSLTGHHGRKLRLGVACQAGRRNMMTCVGVPKRSFFVAPLGRFHFLPFEEEVRSLLAGPPRTRVKVATAHLFCNSLFDPNGPGRFTSNKREAPATPRSPSRSLAHLSSLVSPVTRSRNPQ